MKTFKQHTKEKKKEEGSGLAPAPIHFKHFEELVDAQPTGVIPTAIHFKNILKDKKLNEAKEGSDFKSWMKDRSDNAHLTSKKTVGAANDEIAKKLHSTNKFSDEHVSHITKYTGSPDDAHSHSQKMNTSLIKNKGVPTKAHKKSAEGLSDAIDKNRIQHKVTVYSGTSFDPRKHTDKKGHLKSHAFISATHDKQVAAGFAQKAAAKRDSYAHGHIMKIDLKPNDPATHVGHHSYWNGEHETVINRNTTLKHEKTTSHWSPGEERYYHIHHMSVAKD
jgi:hypothetical protein